MSMFKPKFGPPKTNNAKVTVLPTNSGLNASNNSVTYIVSIESNNADLLNENVNEIEIATEIVPVSSVASSKAGQSISSVIQASRNVSSTPKSRKVGSIDPKTTVAHGSMATLAHKNIKDNIVRESIEYSETQIRDLPMNMNATPHEAIKGQFNFQMLRSQTATRNSMMTGQFSSASSRSSREIFSPLVVKSTTMTLPKKTSVVSQITVSKNETPIINLRNSSGNIIGKVGNKATNVPKNIESPDNPKLLKAFEILNKFNKDPFVMTLSEDQSGFYLHARSKNPAVFRQFEIYVRLMSSCAAKNRYRSLGVYNNITAKKIRLPVSSDKSLIFHLVPICLDEKLSWSQTLVHSGIDEPTSCKIISFQKNVDSSDKEVLFFKLYNIPDTALKVYSIRKNLKSGKQTRLPTINVPHKTSEKQNNIDTITYADDKIGYRNATYIYDFFVIDRYGLEKHIGNHTTRVFEKDVSGIRIRKASSRILPGVGHELSFSVSIPDLWLPEQGDNLLNPGENIIQAARERKKIGIVQLVRHSSYDPTQIIDTFVINPHKNISDIPVELTDEKAISGKFVIDAEFSKKYGLNAAYSGIEYTYELRVGYYFLSNELSFLNNPIKLTVPNQDTSGKTGYSYHPYLFDSPLSKDFSIIPKLGGSKHHLKVEALTNISHVFTFKKNENTIKPPTTLRCNLGANKFGQNKLIPYVTVSSNISRTTLNELDHVELLVANSTGGRWQSLGCHKITSEKFYFIDNVGPKLAANKLKYALIGRNLSFEVVFKKSSSVVSLKKYNYVERDNLSENNISVNQNTNFKLR